MNRGDELIELVRTQGSGEAAGELLSEISAGYPVERLSQLLRSGDPAAIELGAWVASELGSRAAPLLPEMLSLLDSPGRAIKFFASDVVLVCAGPEDGPIIAKAIMLIEDADEAVRWKAMGLLSRLSSAQLKAATNHLGSEPVRALVYWLNSGPAQAEIVARLGDSARTSALVAVAAAVRAAGLDRGALEIAAASADAEVSTFAMEQLELLGIRQRHT